MTSPAPMSDSRIEEIARALNVPPGAEPTPCGEAVRDLLAEVKRLRANEARVRKLHRPRGVPKYIEKSKRKFCVECSEPIVDSYVTFPCPTLRALDGTP